MSDGDRAPAAAGTLERIWPPSGICLGIGDVELRPVRESELGELADILPEDAEHDPSSVMFDELSPVENRRRLFLQSYWKALGTWSPETWTLFFGVHHCGHIVGVQALEGRGFPELRTVDSFSWLTPPARGHGIGTKMRTAVLALAFDRLGAQVAVSSAREDNAASLAVSSHLGYEGNGISLSPSTTGPCILHHMLLRRDVWEKSGAGAAVAAKGLAGCGAWFGVVVSS